MDGMSGVSSRLVSIAAALMLGACSSGSALTTSSLFGGGKEKEAGPPPETMTDRVVHVGTTAARAQHCGYVFDPASLRRDYLAFESQKGATPEVMAKAEKSYDYTFASVTKSIAGDSDYCTEEQTTTIKNDLTRMLTGDFSSPTRKANVGWWSDQKSKKPMDRDAIFDPIR